MDENPFLNYHVFGGCNGAPNVDDIVRIVLDEQKHCLTEEDRKILRDHENLQNVFHTLQNANTFAPHPSWDEADPTESATSPKSDRVHFIDVEAIENPSSQALENIETSNAELDNTMANFIDDENVKAEVFRLNHDVETNAASTRALSNEAQMLMVSKLNLERKLASIEKKIACFSPEEERVKRIKRKKGADCASTGHRGRTYFYRFGVSYFKTKERFPADCNPDLMEIIRTNQPMNVRLPRVKRFLPHDAAFLEQNVLKQLKTKRVEQLRKCMKQTENSLKKDRKNQALADEMRCIARAIAETEAVSHISATKDWNIGVDFMALPQSSRFTSEDYERIWRLTGSPSLTRGEFSEQEYTELKRLAVKYNVQNWDRIASEMSTKRSGFMCFTKYMATEKKSKNKPWTKEENELLHNLCISMDFVSKSDSRYQFWKTVRSHFPNRTYTQLHSHWTYVLEPRLKKGRFTADEKCLMLKLLNEGKSHKEIAQRMQNRTCVQIRTHFEALMQKQLNRGNWTPEEEKKLLQLVEKYGPHDWVRISKELGTRNRSQCRLKYFLYEKNNQRFSLGTRAPKDFWTPEENEQFKELLRKYGPDFKKMSQEMKTRDHNQLRYKYHRAKVKGELLDVVSSEEISRNDKKEKDSWTKEELEWFKQLLMEYGTQYKLISSLTGKSIFQLRYKYSRMKDKWNLPVCSEETSSINEPNQKKRQNTTSISSVASSAPTTCVTKLPAVVKKKQQLSENLLENLTHVSRSDDWSVTSTETCNEPVASISNQASISTGWKENISYPFTEPPCQDTSLMVQPSNRTSRMVWTGEELEQFKLLLAIYGTQYKKISSIMRNKSIDQLRWKYQSMKRKGDLPSVTTQNVESRKCKKPAPRRKVKKLSGYSSAIKPSNTLSENVTARDDSSQKENMSNIKSSALKSVWTNEELEPLFLTSEDHSRLVSNSSSNSMYEYVNVEDGFAGFPDDSQPDGFAGFPDDSQQDGFAGFPDDNQQSSLSFTDLISYEQIEIVEPANRPSSSPEQMIVPEMISEISELSDVSRNECSLSADNLYENCESMSGHAEMDFDPVSYEIVEVKYEIDSIKEEI